MKSFLLPIFVVLTACSYGQQIYTARTAPMQVIQSGPYSNVRDQKLVVISDRTAFERYWTRTMGQPPQTAPGNIDWITKKVLAIHLGQRSTGGYRLQIQGIDTQQMNVSVVRAIEFTPVPGTYVTQGFTSPWALVLVDRQLPNPKLSVIRQNGISTPLNPGITAPGGRAGGNRCTCGPNCPCGCGCGGS